MVKQAPEERLKAVRFCPPAHPLANPDLLGVFIEKMTLSALINNFIYKN